MPHGNKEIHHVLVFHSLLAIKSNKFNLVPLGTQSVIVRMVSMICRQTSINVMQDNGSPASGYVCQACQGWPNLIIAKAKIEPTFFRYPAAELPTTIPRTCANHDVRDSNMTIVITISLIRDSSTNLPWRGKLDPRSKAQGVIIPAKALTKTECLGCGLCNEWRIEAKRYMGFLKTGTLNSEGHRHNWRLTRWTIDSSDAAKISSAGTENSTNLSSGVFQKRSRINKYVRAELVARGDLWALRFYTTCYDASRIVSLSTAFQCCQIVPCHTTRRFASRSTRIAG
ncbi:uncharacterized protein F5147DRAFT_713968 [Suillus discolor]|uniref:Uncharacterized protein n=1 Tax=Suillus discolor TaxID=1912936 RepID=A0A9P7F0P2_9AGAM|nr:uncharacterized protein F5147DRAFT_713968 [Suillus discolor]KAG2098436.1 hypothetical protein F5147DRAFT_713968 [Suillus discolor]